MTKFVDRKWAYFPMEILSRELPSRLLLALELARRGHVAVLGPRKLLQQAGELYPPGLVLYKDLVDREEQFQTAIDHRNKIAVISEEGLVYPSAETYVNRRIGKGSWERIHRLYAWGEQEAHDIKSIIGDERGVIKITGNPRFDVLKAKKSLAENDSGEKEYVLINSTLGAVNPVTKKEKRAQVVQAENEYQKIWQTYYSESETFFELLQELVKGLGEHSEIPVVFRPHPEENSQFWKELTQNFSNIRVDMRFTAVDWIANAAMVVHNNCTTAVEAYAMGVPCVSLGPYQRAGYESLPNSLSLHTETPSQALEMIRKLYYDRSMADSVFGEANQQKMHSRVLNYNGQPAYELIAEDIENLIENSHSYTVQNLRSAIKKIESWYHRRKILNSQSVPVWKQKFPGLDATVLKNTMAQLSTAFSFIEKQPFKLACHDKDIWLVYK